MDKHPEFDIVEITRKSIVAMLNRFEIPSQEAALYSFRERMLKCMRLLVI